MRKLIVAEFMSLDGVIQSPGRPDEDRDGGFAHGGWQMGYADAVSGKMLIDRLQTTGALLLGRRTYDIFAGYWPHAPADNPFSKIMNGLTKYVASRTLTQVDWQNSVLLEGDLAEAVTAIKQADGGPIQVIGSGELAQSLMRHGLVDEYALIVYPVVVGSGKRLFRDDSDRQNLKLVEATTTSSGAVILRYVPQA